MNILDIKKVVEAFGVTEFSCTILDDNTPISRIRSARLYSFSYLGLKFRFLDRKDDIGYVVVENVPFEVLETINQKNPNNLFGVHPRSVDSAYEWADNVILRFEDVEPIVGVSKDSLIVPVIDKQYESEISDIEKLNLDTVEAWGLQSDALMNLYGRMINGKLPGGYIKLCEIDTREGLVLLMSELTRYFGHDTKGFEEINREVAYKILGEINPWITVDDWMSVNGIDNFYSNDVGNELREAIIDFDGMVNPYMMQSVGLIELGDISDYMDKVSVSGSVIEDKNTKKYFGCGTLTITDRVTGNKVSYKRIPGGFSCQLNYKIVEGSELLVRHSFINDDLYGGKEIIFIKYFGRDVLKEREIQFDVTNGKIIDLVNGDRYITDEERQEIYGAMYRAIGFASMITVQNMKKKSNKIIVKEK